MAVLLTADLHIHPHRIHDNYNPDVRRSNRLNDGLLLLDWIYDEAIRNECHSILVLGDLFHVRQHVRVDVLNAVWDSINSKRRQHWYFLAGNHDQYDESTTALHALAALPHCTVIERASVVSFEEDGNTYDCGFLPYRESPENLRGDIEKLRSSHNGMFRYGFAHLSMNGATVGTFEHRPYSDIKWSDFDGVFEQVYAGHYHKPQTLYDGAFVYVGSPMHIDRSDRIQRKYVHILDLKTGRCKPVENRRSPQFAQLFWSKRETAKKARYRGNFVDVKIDEERVPSHPEVEEFMLSLSPRSFSVDWGFWERKQSEAAGLGDLSTISTVTTSPKDAISDYVELHQKPDYYVQVGLELMQGGT